MSSLIYRNHFAKRLQSTTKPKRKLPPIDPNKDFKFFIMKAKVCQVYREALKEAKMISDPDLSSDMQNLMRDEFQVFRQ